MPLRSLSRLAALLIAGAARAGTVVPTDGMVITADTVLTPGSYSLPNGLVIGASGVTLDLNGAALLGPGNGTGSGVRSIGHDGVSIVNGAIHGYFYGVRVESGFGIQVSGMDLSGNWLDPASQTPDPPFLDINVGPNLGDTTNLGGGLFMLEVTAATVTDNVCTGQENGIDLYSVTDSVISGNDCSCNTGWGIHLNASTGNLISGNAADDCIRANLNDSAGLLLVNGSHGNQVLGNSLQRCGDGFFIGNEHGCPSNGNLVQGNDASAAGANAFEATFSSGNQFIDNVADGSNYGFWLGYSHDGNVIRSNSIRANNAAGIEIEHGQNNVIEGNSIIGNGGSGIVLRTDGLIHFPPAQFPCLNLPDQAASSGYTIRDNVIHGNFGLGMQLVATTGSTITNNLVAASAAGTATSNGAGNVWAVAPVPGENIVGGPTLGGNYWGDYAGADTDGDGIGDTLLPYTAGGLIAPPGDPAPLVGDPDLGGFDNPMTLCESAWTDLGPNTRSTGPTFTTANGAHYATDGTELYLLEGTNSTRLSRFDAATALYVPRAGVPEAVFDGGDMQFIAGDGRYYAGVGIQFDPVTGAGKGPRLYAYDPASNTWAARANASIGGFLVATEALAWDPAAGRLYATVVQVQNGGDPTLRRRLAVYDPAANAWTGATAAADVEFAAGSEAEWLDGRVYVWRGGFDGGAVNGSDSYLHVYDVADDSWSTTPALQASGVVPGFRSGAIDIWGVGLTADHARGLLLVIGGEANTQVYVHDPAAGTWAVTPEAAYDGGWGDSLEWVEASQALYQIDGRNIGNRTQGTAVLAPIGADIDGDDVVGITDLLALLAAWGPCATCPCPGDIDGDGTVGITDLLAVLAMWT